MNEADDKVFEGYAPQFLSDKEWRLIKDLANKRIKEFDGNYAKACVIAYFDFLDIVTEEEIKEH